ncbi:hypothetical protein ACTG16_21980 [Aeromonas sp. 23P]|uniref:hypothetical protein n=1 Tax=Aeromonas sp. 23P TaxID=3452716 RepID=UPI003F79D6CB
MKKIFFMAMLGSLAIASGASMAKGPVVTLDEQGAALKHYSECYLESFYASNILQMRYHNMSRFEVAELINVENTNLEDNDAANQINKNVASNLETYIDEVYSMPPETDEGKITSMSSEYMKKVLEGCLNRKKVNTGG